MFRSYLRQKVGAELVGSWAGRSATVLLPSGEGSYEYLLAKVAADLRILFGVELQVR